MALTEGQIIGLVIVLIIMTLLYLNPTWVTAIQNMLSPPVPGTGSTGTGSTGTGSTGTGTGSGSGSTGTTKPPPPPPPPTGPKYTYMGCYQDSPCGPCPLDPSGKSPCSDQRSMPYWLQDGNPGTASSYDPVACYNMAKAAGMNYFSRQYGSQCFGATDYNKAMAAGTSTNCTGTGGDGGCANELYKINY